MFQHIVITQYIISLIQCMPDTNKAGIKLSWLLLDSCLTISGVNNPNIVKNIHTVDKENHMRLILTGGHCDYS